MKISIITVCYNSIETIEKTILSVKNQTYSNIEYIIIDGNSVDGTQEMIRKYSFFVNFWISEPDNGLYDAMNKGIKLATGEIIGILNSDDIFYSNTVVQEIANFHLNHKIDASIGNIVQCRNNGKIVRFYSSKNWNQNKLRFGFMPPHPSIFLSRDLFLKFGYYHLGFKIGADYELITRFFSRNKINWKYSGITTTSMLIGGVSSSGWVSYKQISHEICKSLEINGVPHIGIVINLRFFWKILDLLRKK